MMKAYPKYKDSGIEWIGEIPEGWEVKKFKHIGQAIIGITYSPSEMVSEESSGVLVLRSSNIQNGKLSLKDKVFIKKEIPDKLVAQKGDILICSRNGSRALIGKNICIDERVEGSTFGAFMTVFRTPFYRFASMVLNSDIFLSQSSLYLTTTINQLTIGTLNNFFIPFPPEKEQNLIASFLEAKTKEIDISIKKHQQIITLLQEERQAVINEAVTKGLDPNVPMKDSGIEWIGEVPEGWTLRKLKHVATINPQKGSAGIDKDSTDLATFLPMEKVSENGDYDSSIKKPISDLYNGFTYFEKGDAILAKITPCFENGKGALLSNLETEFGFGSTEFHVLRASELIRPKFLYFILRTHSFMTIGEAFMTGSAGQKRVPTSFIEDYFIGLPKINEQDQIIEFVTSKTSELENEISYRKKEIELLKEYRQSLITEAVTGKIDVRDYSLT